MIRVILKPGPQRGRDVVQWVHDATGYKRAKVYEIAANMQAGGSLRRGLWVLENDPVASASRAKLYVSLSEAILRQREAA